MGYTQIDTIYEGVAEATSYFNDDQEQQMKDFVAATQSFAYDNSDAEVKIYRLYHNHDQGIDCECIQYVTDHNPFWIQEGKSSEK